MKLVSFAPIASADPPRLGVLHGPDVIDAAAACRPEERALFHDAVSFIAAGPEGLRAAERLPDRAPARARHALASVRLAAPIRPSTILCSGSNYRAHNDEKAGTPTSGSEPEFFVKTADCVIGPEDAIVLDTRLTRKLDCEAELAIVIGRPGRHIPVDRAREHVFGYTIANDVTARDRQVRRSPEGFVWYDLGRGKVFDTSAALGPCIVTTDEIADPQALPIEMTINGELRQSASTADMIWSCAELVHAFSVSLTLRPGMVILTGTPAGTAWSTDAALGGRATRQPGLVPARGYASPGDVVSCAIGGIGVLRNRVVAADAASLPPPAAHAASTP